MFGSGILEVAIGLVFVYFLLSLICSALTEFFSRGFAMRSKNLKEGIKNLLNDPDGVFTKADEVLAERFYEHPLIKRLAKQGWFDRLCNRESKPSYISSRDFAIALLDIIAPADSNAEPKAFTDVRSSVTKLSDSEIGRAHV